MDLSVYYQIIIRRKWVIVLTAAVAGLVALIGSLQTPPTYEARVRLQIIPYALSAPDYGSYIYFDRLANTYSEIVSSDQFTTHAKNVLNLEELPDFTIQVIPQTELMRLSVIDTSPEEAQRVANVLAQLLVEENQTTYNVGSGVQTALREQINTLEQRIDELIVEYSILDNQTPRNAERIAEVQRSLNALERNYDLLLNNYNQAAVAQVVRANALSIVQPASLPDEPVGPLTTRNVAIAIVVGLVAGFGLAFLLENVNPLLHNDKQIETILHAPIITRVPVMKKPYRNDAFAGDWVAAEAFRRLRTYLFSDDDDISLRFLLVTSAIPEEGKTTTAANLALAVAHTGRSVLLIDGDMLRPSLHKRYGLSNLAGLSTVLRGRSKLTESVQSYGKSGLHILTAGPADIGAQEMMSSDRFFRLLDEVLQTYELVIFDAPAVLAAANALLIAKQMSGVLWVVDRQKVDRNTLAFAYSQFENMGARLLGVVVNRARRDRTSRWSKSYKPLLNGKQPSPKSTAQQPPARQGAKQ
ncbi:MAG: polysaccharide biosynthesis tyrosine autokinase [Aggregatilineales bacterium]